MTITAIETRYAGCRFRSRLEARWAVFFDSVGLAWEYEPQGFLVGDDKTPYLPDFRITRTWTEAPLWVEVKGSDDALDRELVARAVHPEKGIGGSLLILGPVPEPDPTPLHAVIRNIFGTACMHRTVLGPHGQLMQFGREKELASPTCPTTLVSAATSGHLWRAPEVYTDPSCAAAYNAARSARFEHGECG
jgi:hypothetical protein